MKNVKFVILAFLVCLFLISAGSSASEIRIYTLGDIDDFTYNGVGSMDDVYVDPSWRHYFNGFEPPVNGFDTFDIYQSIPFTFLYDLAINEQIVGATLTLALKSTVLDEGIGGLTTRYMRYGLNDWYPLSNIETTVRSVDMANIHGYNLLPDLQDGQFDVAVHGNIAVDYAILTLEIIPEPATLMLFVLGGLFLKKRSN